MLKKLMGIFNKMFGDVENDNDEFFGQLRCDEMSSEMVCCGQYTDCERPCSCRADYWKDQSRVELNKLALSILGKSLRNDEGYYMSWKSNIAMAFYDVYNSTDTKDIHAISNKAADTFLQNLLYNIENI